MALRSSVGGAAWGLLLASCATLFLSQHHDCHAFTTTSSPSSIVARHHAATKATITSSSNRLAPLSMSSHNYDNRTPRDVLVIGGGLAGLSAAHYIATHSSRHVTILERELPSQQRSKTVAGSFAAAGMLAPQSERLPAGPLLDICLNSRDMYGEWVKGVERGAREASLGVGRGREATYTGEGAKYLWELTDKDGILNSFDGGPSPPLEPWETGFHSTGGFLAPAFAGDAVATWAPQPNTGKAYWLDDIQVRELEPQLHPDVIGGWWFPEDASVDARRLTCSLRAACVGAGVQMNFGKEWEVKSLEMSKGTCKGVHLANGKIYAAKSIIVANGSWMRHLLPLPVTPHKGQSFSLRMPKNAPPILSRVLFAQDTYIVPKADGRIIVGATVEPGRFDGDVTPSGLMHCLSEATRLIPSLGDLPIEESWAGLRPTTPDKCPIIGLTEQWDNVYIAGGYWRNGVLLAPKTGQLIGDLIMNDGNIEKLPEEDQALLNAFSWQRFTTPGGGKALAANARYAATFYPVHKRSTEGVATSVGTELGFYEGAAAATGDRAKDRKAMFGISEDEEEALERAAGMGVGDSQAFSFGGDGWMAPEEEDDDDEESDVDEYEMSLSTTNFGISEEVEEALEQASGLSVGEEGDEWMVSDEYADIGGSVEDFVSLTETMPVEADPDAYTVGVKEDTDEKEETTASLESDVLPSDLTSVYDKIKANKAKASESITMGEDNTEERADPGFRIYHVDKVTRETTEVPPFTSPGEFFQMKDEGKLTLEPSDGSAFATSSTLETAVSAQQSSSEEGEEPLFDGYTAIREAYGEGATAESTADATRKARIRNRIKTSEIDESKIGVMIMPESFTAAPTVSSTASEIPAAKTDDLHSVYEKIRSNKAVASQDIEMGDSVGDEKPKLDFTIYHVDSKTREERAIPQYTSPGEFLDSIEKEKAAGKIVVNGSSTSKPAVQPVVAEKEEPISINGGSDNEGLIDDGSDEKTYDGYQAIQNANSSPSREEEMRKMKEARIANRAKSSGIMGNSLNL